MWKFDSSVLLIATLLFIFYIVLWIVHFYKKTSEAIPFPCINIITKQTFSWRILCHKTLPWIHLIIVFLLFLTILRPQYGQTTRQIARKGIAIQMLIDRSSSMKQIMSYQGKNLARLDVVKKVFLDFVIGDNNELRGRNNDFIGLSSFAGFVEEKVPLTRDHKSLAIFLQKINLAERFEDGTMIGDAIYHSVLRMIAAEQFYKNEEDGIIQSKIMLLLTDGQQTEGGYSPLEAAKFAKKNNIKIYTIAITDKNTPAQNSIFSRLLFQNNATDTKLLKQIANITQGEFLEAKSGESLKEIYSTIDKLEKSSFQESIILYDDYFPYILSICLIFIIIELILRWFVIKKIP